MTEARRLRVMLVADNEYGPKACEVLGTEDLELWCFVGAEGCTCNVVKTFEQVRDLLRKMGSLTLDDLPDLAFYDCHFGDDRSRVPALPRRSDVVDPRGLLYGLALTCCITGANPSHPLGFAVYSMSLGKAARDPYAQTFFMLLQAINGGEHISMTPEECRALMEKYQPQLPADAMGTALKNYRASLKRELVDYPNIDQHSFATAASVLSAYQVDGTPIPDDLWVEWTRPGGYRDRVLVRSLFADCRRANQWNRKALQSRRAVQFLTEIATINEDRQAMYERVTQRIRAVRTRCVDGPLLPPPDAPTDGKSDATVSWMRAPEGYRDKFLGFLMLWAHNRCVVTEAMQEHPGHDVPKCMTVTELCAHLGFDQSELQRTFEHLIGPGMKMTAGRLLLELEKSSEWPRWLPAWVKTLLCTYLERDKTTCRKRSEGVHAPSYRPLCLRP